MTVEQIAARNETLLGTVHPTLASGARRIIAAMAMFGTPVCITQGRRTAQEQQVLYAQGRTTPGKIVTNCDGVVKKSNHQAKDDGFGHAVDFAFVVDLDGDGKATDITWDEHRPWALLGAMVEALGLSWGGRWQTGITDMPHAELRG